MNTQDILTLISVALAFGYAIYSLVKLFMPGRRKTPAHCNSCTICSDRKR